MNFLFSQNPGVGGLDELTAGEEVFVMNLYSLPYQQGDIIYHNGTALTVLHPGTSGQILKTNGVGANPEWTTGGGGGITRSILSISSPTTAGATASTDYVYLVSGTTTLTLPTAVGNTNQYTVKNVGVNTVTVATTSAQTIDGVSTINLLYPQSRTFISDNSNWVII